MTSNVLCSREALRIGIGRLVRGWWKVIQACASIHWHDGSQGSPSFSFAAQRHRSGAFQIKMHLSSDSLQLKADQFSITRSSQMSPMMAAVPIRSTTRHQTTWLFGFHGGDWRPCSEMKPPDPGDTAQVQKDESQKHLRAVTGKQTDQVFW